MNQKDCNICSGELQIVDGKFICDECDKVYEESAYDILPCND